MQELIASDPIPTDPPPIPEPIPHPQPIPEPDPPYDPTDHRSAASPLIKKAQSQSAAP